MKLSCRQKAGTNENENSFVIVRLDPPVKPEDAIQIIWIPAFAGMTSYSNLLELI